MPRSCETFFMLGISCSWLNRWRSAVLSQISTTCTPLAVLSHHVCDEPGWRVLSRVHVSGEGLGILSRYPFEILFQQYDHFVLLDSQSGNAP
jgi:hypothetical protein